MSVSMCWESQGPFMSHQTRCHIEAAKWRLTGHSIEPNHLYQMWQWGKEDVWEIRRNNGSSLSHGEEVEKEERFIRGVTWDVLSVIFPTTQTGRRCQFLLLSKLNKLNEVISHLQHLHCWTQQSVVVWERTVHFRCVDKTKFKLRWKPPNYKP